MASHAERILNFWFGQRGTPDFGTPKDHWFDGGPGFDATLRSTFLDDYTAANAGEYGDWKAEPAPCLALILLFDQFPRNMFRGTPQAFATDANARDLAQRIVERGWDSNMLPVEQLFAYLPFEHSEDLEDQRRSVALFRGMKEYDKKPEWIDYAERHLQVIERFGRFPHRNAVLGRTSTADELEFLKLPNSGF